MNHLKYIFFSILFLSCSNILYKHNEAMSMLNTKNLVLERFGTPTDTVSYTHLTLPTKAKV